MIKSSKDSTKEAFNRIKEGQNGGFKPLKTRFSHLNDISHGGLPRQKIITIGGLSSFGKSHTLRQLEEDIFNEELNPNSKNDVILLKVDWEMTKEEAILNRVQAKTKKPFSYLLYEEPDEETKNAFNEVYQELHSDSIFEIFEPCKTKSFYEAIQEFCDKHKEKRQIVLTIDNSNLIDSEGSNETESLAELQTDLIKLKRHNVNLTIIQLAQLNREIKQRTNLKDMFPRTSDFFNSSKLEHASDIMIVVHNPYLMGYMEYGAVNYEKYEYLSKYILEDSKSRKWVSFKTKGLVFWHYVKVRAKNDLKSFKDIFVEEIFDVDEENDSEININKKIENIPNIIPIFVEEKNVFDDIRIPEDTLNNLIEEYGDGDGIPF